MTAAATCAACGRSFDPAAGSMTSVGLGCPDCSAIEAGGGRLFPRRPAATPISANRAPAAAPALTPGIRLAAFLFFAVVASPCVWTASRDGSIAVANAEPASVTCAELASADPPRAWVRVSDCRLDCEAAVIETILLALPDRAWIPLRPTNSEVGSPFAIVLETHDRELIGRVVAARSGPPTAPLVLDAPTEGMVVAVAELDEDVRTEVAALGGMISGARVLRAGSTPPGWLWIGARALVGLLIVLFGLAVALEKRSSGTRPKPAVAA